MVEDIRDQAEMRSQDRISNSTKMKADPVLDGSKLRVHTPDRTYEGWGRVCDSNGRLMLYDTRRDDGEQFDTVLLDQFSTVELLESVHDIETLSPDDLEPSPYDVREVDMAEADATSVPPERHRQLYRHQKLFSYPTAARREGSPHELIAGHRRLAGAEHAGVREVPVRLVDVDEWTAAKMFVHEHFPYPNDSQERNPELYDESEARKSVELLREKWSDDCLQTLLPLKRFLNTQPPEPYP